MNLSSLVPDLRETIPDCPQKVALRHLKRAVQDLCRKSMCWTNVMSATIVTSDMFPLVIAAETAIGFDTEISWDAPLIGGERVIKIVAVSINGGAPLEFATEADMVGDWRTNTGVPERFIEEPQGTLILFPLPLESSSMIVDVVLEPGPDSYEFKDSIATEFREEIVSGALYRLFILPGQPWASVDLATYHKAVFDEGIRRASVPFQQRRRIGAYSTTPFQF